MLRTMRGMFFSMLEKGVIKGRKLEEPCGLEQEILVCTYIFMYMHTHIYIHNTINVDGSLCVCVWRHIYSLAPPTERVQERDPNVTGILSIQILSESPFSVERNQNSLENLIGPWAGTRKEKMSLVKLCVKSIKNDGNGSKGHRNQLEGALT